MFTDTETTSYREVRLPTPEDPLRAVTALAGSGLFDQYVVYESEAEWSFAGGRLADLRASRTGAVVRHGSDSTTLSDDENLSATVRGFLAAVPVSGWRAYGWAAFELAYLNSELAPLAGDDVLLHLLIPHTEVRITAQDVLLRSADEATLERVAMTLRDPPKVPSVPSVRLEVPVEDTGNYRAVVAAAVAAIRAGDLQKVILSRVLPVPEPVDLIATYAAGRAANTPARSYLLNLGRIRAAGFSPETVVEVGANGRIATQPLAGTRALTGSPAQDLRLRAELLTDPKEIYEHAVSVKTACDELSALCEPGSVQVGEFMTVRERGTVQHLASTVTGRLPAPADTWHAFDRVFPAVTASGIPKPAAYRLIHDLENQERGLYAGSVLTCDHLGQMDAALVLRTVFQHAGRTWLQAGAGIVSQSLPEREHEETCEKLRSVAQYLVPAHEPGQVCI
jgi:anthranilate synthase component 1/salicylate synthetase